MIIAKIKRKVAPGKPAGSERAYAVHLTRYIVRAHPADLRKLAAYGDDEYLRDLARYVIAEGRAEEVLATGKRNLFGRTLEDQQAEMLALMSRCTNPAGAIDHWVFSWAEGEEPSTDEINKTVDIFLRCQKLERCPAIWGYHGDSDNRHFHLEVLRIDRRTGKRQTAGGGWDIDTAQRAKAVIEHAFPQWKREKRSQYEVVAGVLMHKQSGTEIGPADQPHLWGKPANRSNKAHTDSGQPTEITSRLDQKSRDYEEQTGFKSRTRLALEVAVPIALQSSSWDECHQLLAAEGIALEKTRYGANFIIDGKPLKASIDRRTSFANLKKRYGGEEFSGSRHKLEATPPREMWPDDARRREYYAAKWDHDERRKAIVGRFRAAHGRARGVDKAALDAASAGASFPPFEAWASGSMPADPVETIAAALGFAVFESAPVRAPGTTTVRTTEFKVIRLKDRVIYCRPSDPPGRPAFIDLGDRVLVNAARDHTAVRAALLLVVQNHPGCPVAVYGDKAFKKLALEIATQEGVVLHGDLGRQQERLRARALQEASKSTDQARPIPAPVYQPSLMPGSATRSQPAGNAPQASGGSQRSQSPARQEQDRKNDAALAVIWRLFHSLDWDPSEYWPDHVQDGLKADASAFLRGLGRLRNLSSAPSGGEDPQTADAKRRAAENARQAAAMAANASRSM